MARVYHATFRAVETRHHSRPPTFTFGAADQAAATAVASVLETYTLAKLIRLTEELSSHNKGADHPAGTHFSVKMWVKDADKSVVRYMLRNLKSGVTEDDIKALMTGAANTSLTRPVLALGAAPSIPWAPHDPLTTVSVLINDLS